MQTLADLGIAAARSASRCSPPGWPPAFARWGAATKSTVRSTPRHGLLVLVAVVVTFGVHSAIDWTWFIPGTALPAIIAAGWVAGRDRCGRRGRPPRRVARDAAARRRRHAGPGRHRRQRLEIWQPLRSSDAGNAALTALTTGHVTAAASSRWRPRGAIPTPQPRGTRWRRSTPATGAFRPRRTTSRAPCGSHPRPDPVGAPRGLRAARARRSSCGARRRAYGPVPRPAVLRRARVLPASAQGDHADRDPTAPTATPGAPTALAARRARPADRPDRAGTAPRTPGVQRRH